MKHLNIAAAMLLCTTPALAQPADISAKANFIDQQGQSVGTARLTQTAHGVLIDLDLKNVPAGPHGFHIHQSGICDGGVKFASAGGHFGISGQEHGYQAGKGPHAGDLPNLIVPAGGALKIELFTPGVTLAGGETSLFDADGSALVIHAKGDDYKTQPAGDSGDRIACAIIQK